MSDVENRKISWQNLIGKFLYISKFTNLKTMTYKGTIKSVFDDSIIFTDVVIGDLPLSYDGLSVIGIKELEDRGNLQ